MTDSRYNPDCPAHDTRCRPGACALDRPDAGKPRGFPPPLPDRFLEPYEVVSRSSEETTQREGMLKDPRDLLISSLQQEVHTLRLIQQLPSDPPPPFDDEDEPAPDTRPSLVVLRRQKQVAVTLTTLKGLAVVLLPVLGGIVAKHWPEWSWVVDHASSFVGLE